MADELNIQGENLIVNVNGSQVWRAAAVPAPVPIPTPSPSDFESAVLAAFHAGRRLNWQGGDVTLTRPILVPAVQSVFNAGIDLNGAMVTCDFADATQSAISLVVQKGPDGKVLQNVNIFGYVVENGVFVAKSSARGALHMECRSNGSWIDGYYVDNITVSGFAGAAFSAFGSVFEGLYNRPQISNCLHGFQFRNTGMIEGDAALQDHDVGIVSAIVIRDPSIRDCSGDGLITEASVMYREPYDFTVSGGYIVDNNGYGLNFASGFSALIDIGFENNRDAAVNCLNGGEMVRCRGTSDGRQPYLVRCFLTGRLTLVDCAATNEGSATNTKIANLLGGSAGMVLLDRTDNLLDGVTASVKVMKPQMVSA